MPPVSEGRAEKVGRKLRLLAHPERLRILDILRREPECVCHLEAALGRTQPYISQQLGVLRTAGIVAQEKDGLNAFYRVVDEEVLRWLSVLLGPALRIADAGYGHGSSRQAVPGCPCPKCSVGPENSAAGAGRANQSNRR